MSIGSTVRNRWATLGRVLLFFLSCAVLLALAAPCCSRLPGQLSQVVLGSITTVATFIVTGLFLRWDKLRLRDVGVAPNAQSMSRAIAGFAFGVLLVGIQTWFVSLGGHVHWVRTSSVGFAPVAMALLAYITLASREELAFRGYPLRRLDSSFGAWTAQLVVALVFAIEHVVGGVTWTNALLGVFVGSLLFGMAALVMRGLAVPIGLHAAWNFGQWTLGEKETSGLWRPVIEQGYKAHVDRVGMLSYLLVFGAATIAVWLFGNFRTRRERKQAMDVMA
ncbi:CPBP family intramembrane glutamic endopeptidase [Edaphobacter dinghuensis]|nr:type II CAAX endopeptidase family protein [Edaphobacter dinghuensis]